MRCPYRMLLAMTIAAALAGCGRSGDAPQASTSATTGGAQTEATATADDPAIAVREFLQGIKDGDDQKVSQRMTKLSREKIGEQGFQIAPQASDTAKFEVGKVEYVGEDGARVAATWSDVGPDQQMQSDNMLWVVRKDAEGWRILGMALDVFEGEPPLLLDFEKPDQTKEKLQWLREEVVRRAAAAQNLQAQQNEASPPPIQR